VAGVKAIHPRNKSISLVNGGLKAGPQAREVYPALTMGSAKSAGRAELVQPEEPMPITEIPIFSMLRTRMHWNQERQKLLSENVANADTPKFQPRDLAPLTASSMRPSVPPLALAQTEPSHLASIGGDNDSAFQMDRKGDFEVRPGGNGVNLEDEMLKVAGNQMDFQAATALYTRGLGLIKTALGKR
jgi:flagellar basal-body rod protein FlgB